MPNAELLKIIPAALKAGFRHIDTAQIYQNEAGVGEGWLASGVGADGGVHASTAHELVETAHTIGKVVLGRA
jgi:2,5-diketo-D-gluconate reductase B